MLTLKEIENNMNDLDSWSLEGNSIVKNFSFDDFRTSLEFVNKVGEIAERLEHHPDIIINFGKVKLSLTTHSLSGLSKKDFEVAMEIDKI